MEGEEGDGRVLDYAILSDMVNGRLQPPSFSPKPVKQARLAARDVRRLRIRSYSILHGQYAAEFPPDHHAQSLAAEKNIIRNLEF